ncbi:hypothetical protein D3C83_88690 [compost metagenome]
MPTLDPRFFVLTLSKRGAAALHPESLRTERAAKSAAVGALPPPAEATTSKFFWASL